MVSFTADTGTTSSYVPPTAEYAAAIKVFLRDFPQVKVYSAWNEPDWVYRPQLAKNPALAAWSFQHAGAPVPRLHGRRRRPVPPRTPSWGRGSAPTSAPEDAAGCVGAAPVLRRAHAYDRPAADDDAPRLRADLADGDQRRRAPWPLAVPEPERHRGGQGRAVPVLAAEALPPDARGSTTTSGRARASPQTGWDSGLLLPEREPAPRLLRGREGRRQAPVAAPGEGRPGRPSHASARPRGGGAPAHARKPTPRPLLPSKHAPLRARPVADPGGIDRRDALHNTLDLARARRPARLSPLLGRRASRRADARQRQPEALIGPIAAATDARSASAAAA